MLIINLLIVFFIIFVLIKSVVLVPHVTAVVIERFKKYHRTLYKYGFSFVIPFIEKTVIQVDLREQTIESPVQIATTKDNFSVMFNAVAYYQIVDAAKVVYDLKDYENTLVFLIVSTIRSIISKIKLDDMLNAKDEISSMVCKITNAALSPLGLCVNKLAKINIQALEKNDFIEEEIVIPNEIQTLHNVENVLYELMHNSNMIS